MDFVTGPCRMHKTDSPQSPVQLFLSPAAQQRPKRLQKLSGLIRPTALLDRLHEFSDFFRSQPLRKQAIQAAHIQGAIRWSGTVRTWVRPWFPTIGGGFLRMPGGTQSQLLCHGLKLLHSPGCAKKPLMALLRSSMAQGLFQRPQEPLDLRVLQQRRHQILSLLRIPLFQCIARLLERAAAVLRKQL